MIYFFSYIIIISIANYYIKKKNYILSNTGFNHQTYVNKSTPLSGGIFLLLPILNLFFLNHLMFSIILILIFFLGLLSDLNILSSARKRFIIQILLILFFVFVVKLEVLPTRIEMVDVLFENKYLSYFFTLFCLMVLLNGSNFIDGLNGLLLGYILIVFFILTKLDVLSSINLSDKKILFLISSFSFLFILNFLNKLFMGDSGAYSLGFLLGYSLIEIYNQNIFISPYFIILLLWYPCFENLFSIIRKIYSTKNPLNPDNDHLHHYLFSFLKIKFNFSNYLTNIFASILINIFNLAVLFYASTDVNNTMHQLYIMIFSILIYLITYFSLKKITKKIIS